MTKKFGKPEFVPARAGSLPKLIDGSVKKLCAKCRRHKVWVTPQMEKLEMRAICPTCSRASHGRRVA